MAYDYVHGYSGREHQRLLDQAGSLVELLHSDTAFPAGSDVLEAGCGVGAQTVTIAASSPGARFLSIDISPDSLAAAQDRVRQAGLTNVSFQQADIFNLPFPAARFDHVFVCFVLEHLSDPHGALLRLKSVLKPGGTITVIEGDHGSTYFHPDNEEARRAVSCLVEVQARMGGNSLIGRQLYPLLDRAGFRQVSVSPRMVYVDGSKPALIDSFTRKTFTAMVEGVREPSLAAGLMDPESWQRGIDGLYRSAASDGVFCYTFFKARGVAP
jgi:SAM-dependent methyltransferase